MADDLTHYMEATERMRQRAEAAEAERDRLRAVVDAARTYMESVDSTDPTITRQYRQESMAALRRALRADG